METTKDLFLMMREQEISTDNFLPTKKEIQKTSKDFAQNLVDSGNFDIKEIYSQAIRLKETLTNVESILKTALPEENFEAFGLKGTYRGGGNSINYSEDEVYLQLKKDLDDRAELLKLAQSQEVLDMYGNEVPKVSTTPRKASLAISY